MVHRRVGSGPSLAPSRTVPSSACAAPRGPSRLQGCCSALRVHTSLWPQSPSPQEEEESSHLSRRAAPLVRIPKRRAREPQHCPGLSTAQAWGSRASPVRRSQRWARGEPGAPPWEAWGCDSGAPSCFHPAQVWGWKGAWVSWLGLGGAAPAPGPSTWVGGKVHWRLVARS